MAGAWRGCWNGRRKAPSSAGKSSATGARSRSRHFRRARMSSRLICKCRACRLGSFSTSGTQNRKRAPLPATLEASMPPPCAVRMARVIARPMPDPLRIRRRACPDRTSQRSAADPAASMPGPLSSTQNSSRSSVRLLLSVMRLPGGVYAATFSSRWRRTRPSRCGSNQAGSSHREPSSSLQTECSPCAQPESCATPPRPVQAARGDAAATSSPAPHWRRSRPSPRLRQSAGRAAMLLRR